MKSEHLYLFMGILIALPELYDDASTFGSAISMVRWHLQLLLYKPYGVRNEILMPKEFRERGQAHSLQFYTSVASILTVFATYVVLFSMDTSASSKYAIIGFGVLFVIFVGFFGVAITSNLRERQNIRKTSSWIRSTRNPSLPELVYHLNKLRNNLIDQTKRSKRVFPLAEDYQLDLCRKIDLLFSCICEIRFKEMYKEQGNNVLEDDDQEPLDRTEKFDNAHLIKWMKQLEDHFAKKQKWWQIRGRLRKSPSDIATLKYVLDKQLQFFKINYPSLYNRYSDDVSSHYNTKEQVSRDRIANIIDLGKLVLISAASAFFGSWFALMLK